MVVGALTRQAAVNIPPKTRPKGQVFTPHGVNVRIQLRRLVPTHTFNTTSVSNIPNAINMIRLRVPYIPAALRL